MAQCRNQSTRLLRFRTFGFRHSLVIRISSFVICLSALPVFAQTNSAAVPLLSPSLPDAGGSVLRVFGALALVIGIFLGGVWLFKNWQTLAAKRGRAPKMSVLETRSLGGRHALHVVGYEQERFLIASSPGGVNLVSHLPGAVAEGEAAEAKSHAPSFGQALAQMLKGK